MVTIEIFSIIPTTVFIGQEKEIIRQFSLQKLQTKQIQICLNEINDDIVELFVNVEKKWRPNIISKNSLEIPLGVNIKSIKIESS
jgi:hypothetical protein